MGSVEGEEAGGGGAREPQGHGKGSVLDSKGDGSHGGSGPICQLGQDFCPYGSKDIWEGTVHSQDSQGLGLSPLWLPREVQKPYG